MAEPKTRLGRLLFRDRKPEGLKVRTTPSGHPIVEFPPAAASYLRMAGVWGDYGGMYRKQPAVRSVVDFLARNLAQLEPEVFERAVIRGVEQDIELADSDLAQLLHYPTGRPQPSSRDQMARFRHQFATFADKCIYDRAYWLKVRGDGGKVVAIPRIPVTKIWPVYDYDNRLLHYLTSSGEKIDPGDLVVFAGYSPYSNDGSTSPMETLRLTLEEDYEAAVNRKWYWRNAARQGSVIERPLDAPEWSKEERDRFIESWHGALAGPANAGKSRVLEDGMKYVIDSAFSPKDSEYIEGRRLTIVEVARAFGIPPEVIGAASQTGVTGAEARHEQTYQDVFEPWTTWYQDEVDLQLVPEFDPFAANPKIHVVLDLDQKLTGSFIQEAEIITKAVGGPWMTRAEARARKRLKPLDDPLLEELVVPLNVQLGGGPQAAPDQPTEVPGDKALPHAHDHGKAAPTDDRVRISGREMASDGDRFAAEHAAELATFFGRQRQVLKSRLGAGKDLDWERWDLELGEELYRQSREVSGYFGKLAAAKIGGTFDPAFTVNFWRESARRAAEGINQETALRLLDPDTTTDEVLDELVKTRAPQVARTRTTKAMNWSLLEAARQSGVE